MPLRTKESSASVPKEPAALMSLRPSLLLVVALAALAPGTAAAQHVRVVSRDVPLDAARVSAARSAPVSFTMVGIHWQGTRTGLVQDSGAARPLRTLAAGAAGSGGHARCRERRAGRARRLAYREPLVDGGRALDPVPACRPRHPPAHILLGQPGDRRRSGRGVFTADCGRRGGERRPGAAAADGPAGRVGRRRDDRPRRAGDRRPASLRDRPPHGRLEQLLALPSRPRSCAASSATTCSGTAGTTSATTSSSTSTAGCSRAVAAGSRRTSSARMRGGFNTGSVGVAVLGNYNSAAISPRRRTALQKLLAWRLDVGARLSARPLVDSGVRWELALAGRDFRPAARGLRATVTRARRAVRGTGSTACSVDRPARHRDRPAEALEPRGRGKRRRASSVSPAGSPPRGRGPSR